MSLRVHGMILKLNISNEPNEETINTVREKGQVVQYQENEKKLILSFQLNDICGKKK